MQAYEPLQRQQGLFTFYRQEAELEDKLKIRKKQSNIKKRQNQLFIQHSTHFQRIAHKNTIKIGENFSKQRTEESEQVQKLQISMDTQKAHKKFQKKLLQILQKHKHDRNKRQNKNLAVNAGVEDPIALKYHLEALMQEQNQVSVGKVTKQDISPRKKKRNLADTLQKVAIYPTNFQTELDQIDRPNQSNQFISKKLSQMSNSNARKLYKSFVWVEGQKNKVGMHSQIIHRQLLPKIPVTKISKNTKKSSDLRLQLQNKTSKQRKKQAMDCSPAGMSKKVKSIRNKGKLLYSARDQNQSDRNKHCQNKIYAIFVENKAYKKNAFESQIDKEKKVIEIARKLKFS